MWSRLLKGEVGWRYTIIEQGWGFLSPIKCSITESAKVMSPERCSGLVRTSTSSSDAMCITSESFVETVIFEKA